MSDMFLVLAQAPAGLSCFLVPRALDDGTHNPFAVQRLKDKLGNRSNASSEIELEGTWGSALARRDAASGPSWTWSRPLGSTASSAHPGPMVAEALECLGGNGFVEENGLARLYREAPLNSIWEGSGNVNALDVVRAVTREPAAVAAFTAELELARGADRRLDAAITSTASALLSASTSSDHSAAQISARAFVEQLATTMQASLLARFAPAYVSEAFVASRLAGAHGHTFGTMPGDLVEASAGKVIERSFPG
jgi:hypothetical protein